jgi:hypothetical protein
VFSVQCTRFIVESFFPLFWRAGGRARVLVSLCISVLSSIVRSDHPIGVLLLLLHLVPFRFFVIVIIIVIVVVIVAVAVVIVAAITNRRAK